jgi:GDP-mannose transporter
MADDKKSDDYRVDIPSSARSSRAPSPVMRASSQKNAGSITENPVAAILGYCGSSILMTVTNKYVLSGVDFNLNFFLLAVQVWQYKAIVQSTVLTRYRLSSV